MRERPGDFTSLESMKGSSIGQAPSLPTNIRLGWEGLPGANTEAYYENLYLTPPDMSCDFYLAKNHKIVINSTTA